MTSLKALRYENLDHQIIREDFGIRSEQILVFISDECQTDY